MLKPTKSMVAAVAKVRPSERNSARILAESVYFQVLKSLSMQDVPASEIDELAGGAAAAEVLYMFS